MGEAQRRQFPRRRQSSEELAAAERNPFARPYDLASRTNERQLLVASLDTLGAGIEADRAISTKRRRLLEEAGRARSERKAQRAYADGPPPGHRFGLLRPAPAGCRMARTWWSASAAIHERGRG